MARVKDTKTRNFLDLFLVEVFIWQVSGTPHIFSNFMADFLKILQLESQLRYRNTSIVSCPKSGLVFFPKNLILIGSENLEG